MTDREKVINGLREMSFRATWKDIDRIRDKFQPIINDALSLLKEQEPKPMIEVEDDDLYAWSPEDVSYYCPRPECGKEISYDYNFCPYCGQAVKLNES